jgi:hypothetical protein
MAREGKQARGFEAIRLALKEWCDRAFGPCEPPPVRQCRNCGIPIDPIERVQLCPDCNRWSLSCPGCGNDRFGLGWCPICDDEES